MTSEMMNQKAPLNRMQGLGMRLAWMPMAAGLLSLVAWLAVGWDPLLVVGYGALVIGLMAAFVVPFLMLRAWSVAPNVRNTVLISCLALANLPVTFLAVKSGVDRMTRYRVTLCNEAESLWQDVCMIGQDTHFDVESVPAGHESVRDLWFSPSDEGELKVRYVDDGGTKTLVVDGYVCRNLGGSVRLIRDASGSVNVATPR